MLRLNPYFSIILDMGMKRQLNLKSYRMNSNSFLNCSMINKIMNRRQFCLVDKCLHLGLTTYIKDKNLLGYDKMDQVHEVVNVVRNNFTRV